MADYRLSVNIISRGKGQSSIASAAYRTASRLIDERTGEIHDYTRKQGVTHSEVLAPQGTPEWMHDRSQLWNAVEAVERRKDAQLSREIQLSLPHELDQAQRKALLLDFVQEQFVNHGMIADVAIHEPSREGDERNHHAHVMLTMRELTGDGLGKKNRDWNSPDVLANWREQWAHHQNRTLERHGHDARVDHRSFEAQGVDREPTQHLGPVANEMEKRGKESRIGNENRAIDQRNTERAHDHIAAARVAGEISRFEGWAQERFSELKAAQDLTLVDLDRRQHLQRQRLEARMNDQYGQAKATIKAELQTIDKKLEAKGVRKVLRDVFGRTRTDHTARQEFAASLKDIQQRETEQRQALDKQHHTERGQLEQRMEARQKQLERGVEKARQRREYEGWQRNVVKSPTPQKTDEKPKPTPKPKPQGERGEDPTLQRLRDSVASAAPQERPDQKPPQKPVQSPSRSGEADIPPFLRRDPQPALKPKGMPPVSAAPVTPTRSKSPPPEPAPESDRLGLDDKKLINDQHLNERGEKPMPWERAEASKGKPAPWKKERGEDRERGRFTRDTGRTRKPE